MTRIAFIISAVSPQSEDRHMASLREKYRPVFEELLQRGVEGRLEAFDSQEGVDWSQYSMLIPSPALEYTGATNYQALLSWLARLDTQQKSLLQNPGDVIRWNTHKSYLLDLEHRGELEMSVYGWEREKHGMDLVKCFIVPY